MVENVGGERKLVGPNFIQWFSSNAHQLFFFPNWKESLECESNEGKRLIYPLPFYMTYIPTNLHPSEKEGENISKLMNWLKNTIFCRGKIWSQERERNPTDYLIKIDKTRQVACLVCCIWCCCNCNICCLYLVVYLICINEMLIHLKTKEKVLCKFRITCMQKCSITCIAKKKKHDKKYLVLFIIEYWHTTIEVPRRKITG